MQALKLFVLIGLAAAVCADVLPSTRTDQKQGLDSQRVGLDQNVQQQKPLEPSRLRRALDTTPVKDTINRGADNVKSGIDTTAQIGHDVKEDIRRARAVDKEGVKDTLNRGVDTTAQIGKDVKEDVRRARAIDKEGVKDTLDRGVDKTAQGLENAKENIRRTRDLGDSMKQSYEQGQKVDQGKILGQQGLDQGQVRNPRQMERIVDIRQPRQMERIVDIRQPRQMERIVDIRQPRDYAMFDY